MKTLHLSPDTVEDQIEELTLELRGRAARGECVAVTIAEEDERLSPAQAAERLGFSRQHVVRLVEAGELPAERLEGSRYWKLPLRGIVAFEQRRERARAHDDAFSRSLDEAGAPLE
jgi:excisionase family DNA binding protein